MSAFGDDEGNPFKLPTDDQWFFFQEQGVIKKEEERERVRHQRVHEKTTASARIAANRRVDAGAIIRSGTPSDTFNGSNTATPTPTTPPTLNQPALPPCPSAASSKSGTTTISTDDAWRDCGGKHKYLAKKNEVFLTQMALNVKKAEIVKLEEKATRKEEALKASQQQLEDDIQKFDAFLQLNDQKAHKAMKAAEEQTKKKNEKQQRIRQLKSDLGALQSEIAKLREQKDECLKFKAFLENITPLEWKETKASEKAQRKEHRKKMWVDARMQANDANMQSELAAEEKAMEERAAECSRSRKRTKRELEEDNNERERELDVRKRRIRKKYPTRDSIESNFTQEQYDVSSGEDMPLYFKEPGQLLDVFTAMEESNLFLIQNSQDTEQAIEEVQQKSDETLREADAARERMNQQVTAQEKQIEEERIKGREFRQKVAQQGTTSDQEALELYLCEKAKEVYAACGHEVERDPDTLKMLAATEAKIEEFLSLFDEAENNGFGDIVEKLERDAETARRAMHKRLRKEMQDRKNKERTMAALQRSQAPIHKKMGKQIMFRSPPGYTAQRVVEEDDGFEEAVREHTVFGIWTGKDGAPNSVAPSKELMASASAVREPSDK